MKRKVFFASLALALGLALLGPARPSLAAETGSDTISRLIKEGWTLVSPNVLQRDMGNGKVETIGFGVEGLKFKIEGMKKDLAFFKESLRRNPDYQVRQTVQAYRAEIKRLTKNLALMVEAEDEVVSKAGIDCTIKYGAHVNAFPLSTSQGVGASADSYFNNNCTVHGQRGEVWVTTTSEARNATGTFTRSIKTDPLAGVSAPYIGYNVSAASSTSVNGVTECLSHAYASMTSYDIGVVYEQRAENRLCPITMSVSITGPTSSFVLGTACKTLTWTASVTGGTPTYTYSWYRNGYAVGTNSSSYSQTFCGSNTSYSETVNLSVTVRDTTGATASDPHSTTINYTSSSTTTCPSGQIGREL
jgi:hypothetical protein